MDKSCILQCARAVVAGGRRSHQGQLAEEAIRHRQGPEIQHECHVPRSRTVGQETPVPQWRLPRDGLGAGMGGALHKILGFFRLTLWPRFYHPRNYQRNMIEKQVLHGVYLRPPGSITSRYTTALNLNMCILISLVTVGSKRTRPSALEDFPLFAAFRHAADRHAASRGDAMWFHDSKG